jgi:hypothetical protein
MSGGCGSFYAIHISSPQFKGLSTIKQHKLVNECLKEEVKAIHGLQVRASAWFFLSYDWSLIIPYFCELPIAENCCRGIIKPAMSLIHCIPKHTIATKQRNISATELQFHFLRTLWGDEGFPPFSCLTLRRL